jgi:hypothetical protein
MRLAREARQVIGIVGQRVGQHLDCDVAIQLGIGGAIHSPHAAFAEFGRDALVRDLRSGRHLLDCAPRDLLGAAGDQEEFEAVRSEGLAGVLVGVWATFPNLRAFVWPAPWRASNGRFLQGSLCIQGR